MNSHLRIAENLANLLDNKFQFGPIKFGLDPILGLFWGGGSLMAAALAMYIIWIGIQMKVPAEQLAQMIGNVVFDFVLGLIPIFGQIADFQHKSNLKNLEILKKYAKADIIEGDYSYR